VLKRVKGRHDRGDKGATRRHKRSSNRAENRGDRRQAPPCAFLGERYDAEYTSYPLLVRSRSESQNRSKPALLGELKSFTTAIDHIKELVR